MWIVLFLMNQLGLIMQIETLTQTAEEWVPPGGEMYKFIQTNLEVTYNTFHFIKMCVEPIPFALLMQAKVTKLFYYVSFSIWLLNHSYVYLVILYT